MDKIKEIRRFFLLQVNDALFPIGGYSHSQGLETYIQQGIVHDEETAAEYIGKKLKLNLACTDLLGVRLAYEYALEEDVAALDMLEEMYQTLGYDDAYPAFLEQFANVMAGGQISVSGFSNTQNHAAASEYSGFQWFDADAGYDESYYETYSADLSLLETTEVDGRCVLELSEEDWEIVNDAAMQMFAVYDGFYVDMGLDDYCEFDDYGNLIVEYDQTWVALDGQVVPFFHESYTSDGDSFFTCGSVPCVYNGIDAEIVLVWDTEHPSGYAAGVRPVYTDSVAAKGLYDICDGDTFQVYYDIYDEDLNYVETMTLDDEIFTVQDSLEVGYADAAEQLGDTFIYYVLEDIYNNTYYTDSIAYLEE